MARIKSGPQGLYYDENDTGPDQGSPEEIAAFKAKQTSGTMDAPSYGTSGPGGAIEGPQRQTSDPNAPGYDPGVAGPLYDAAMKQEGGDSAWSAPAAPAPAAAAPQQYSFMEGVDSAKMNDLSHTTPKYQAARILASGGSLADAAKAIGATVIGPDTMRLATGETIDTRRDIEGANQLQWLVTNDPNAQAATGAAQGAIGSGSGTGGSIGGIGTGAFGSGGTFGGLFDAIMGKANQSLDINRKDPIIANQVNAYDAAQTRAGRDYLRQEAEQAGPQGNLNQEARMVAEKRGQNTGAFQAQIMQQELTQRRNEIMQALQMGASYLTDQQKMALTRELAQMENALAYANLGQRAYEFDSSDEFRRSPLAS